MVIRGPRRRERGLAGEAIDGEDGPAVAAVLNDLGIASGEEERFREALEILCPSQHVGDQGRGLRAPQGATSVEGVYREAKRYEQALSVLTQMRRMSGASSTSPRNLGVVSDYDGCYDEAVSYHKRALNMQRAVFGRDAVTSDVANSHENPGSLGHRGDYVEAERHLETAVEMRRSLPSQSRAVVRARAKLRGAGAARARLPSSADARAGGVARRRSAPGRRVAVPRRPLCPILSPVSTMCLPKRFIDAAQERKMNVKLFTLLGPSSLELLDQPACWSGMTLVCVLYSIVNSPLPCVCERISVEYPKSCARGTSAFITL